MAWGGGPVGRRDARLDLLAPFQAQHVGLTAEAWPGTAHWELGLHYEAHRPGPDTSKGLPSPMRVPGNVK